MPGVHTLLWVSFLCTRANHKCLKFSNWCSVVIYAFKDVNLKQHGYNFLKLNDHAA